MLYPAMNPICFMHARRLRHAIEDRRQFYGAEASEAQQRSWQLRQLNRQWQYLSHTIPYYQALQQSHGLPDAFDSLETFGANVPAVDRATVQANLQDMTDPVHPPDGYRITGGSTGQPLSLPAWASEHTIAAGNAAYGRSYYHVRPDDRLFLIWGHGHLLGRGWRGWINAQVRVAKDRLLGYYRHSAYQLGEDDLLIAGEAMLKFRPRYLIGYAAALQRFAEVNESRADALRQLGLKVAIATAEPFPREDSPRYIADLLGCPVAMEYGMIEAGAVAYGSEVEAFTPFWQHFLLEAERSNELPDASHLLITTLYPRCFPLVRYRVGDLIEPVSDAPQIGLHRFKRIIGRQNDILHLPDGTPIHPQLFIDAVKPCREIRSFQWVQTRHGQIKLQYIAAAPILEETAQQILARLQRVDAPLASVQIERADALRQTVAGKLSPIIRET